VPLQSGPEYVAGGALYGPPFFQMAFGPSSAFRRRNGFVFLVSGCFPPATPNGGRNQLGCAPGQIHDRMPVILGSDGHAGRTQGAAEALSARAAGSLAR
jgi:hypothetical protein